MPYRLLSHLARVCTHHRSGALEDVDLLAAIGFPLATPNEAHVPLRVIEESGSFVRVRSVSNLSNQRGRKRRTQLVLGLRPNVANALKVLGGGGAGYGLRLPTTIQRLIFFARSESSGIKSSSSFIRGRTETGGCQRLRAPTISSIPREIAAGSV